MAVTDKDVLKKLHTVAAPGTSGSLVEAGAVRHVEVDGGRARVLLAVEASSPELPESIRAEAERAVSAIAGITEVEVKVQTLLATAQPGAAPAAEARPTWADKIPDVRRVIAVASGKGGVGKSTVAANLALALAADGDDVGLLDADIYGPSQQMMMGASEGPTGDPEGRIRPAMAPGDVRVMSFGYIIDADQPVIWRGPMLQKALEQFIGDVAWGHLDELVVDLPPGTGDVALTLCQNVPMAGALIVTTPQDVALIDARKALNMFRKLSVPVLGLVENMSAYRCPKCGHTEHMFGSGGGRRVADELGIPLLGEIPLDPAVVTGGDAGKPVVLDRPESAAGRAFLDLARKVRQRLEQS